jgi:hypothetical protein
MKDTFPCHLHHSVGKYGAHQYPCGSDDKDRPEGSSLGTDGRVEEIDRVVTDTNDEVRDGEKKEYANNQDVITDPTLILC